MVLKPRQPCVGFALCAAVGIVAADALTAHAPALWLAAVTLSILAFVLAWKLASSTRIAAVTLSPAISTAQLAGWLAVATLFFAWHAYRLGAGPGRRLADRIPPPGCVVRGTGVVNEEPVAESRFRVRMESIAFNDQPAEPCRAEILLACREKCPAYGDRIEFVGSARNLQPPQNPGGRETVAQRHRQGIFSEIRVRYPNDLKITAHGQGQSLMTLSFALRHSLEQTLAVDLEDQPRELALIHCMVLGSRTDESMQEVVEQFQYTGAIHLYAVTGMNVVVLVAMAAMVFRACRIPRRCALLALLPLIWFYAFATGLGSSTLRAAVMISVYLIGALIDRPALSWNSLGIATVAVLAWSPGQLFKHGFVFSFLIVAAMMATTTRLRKRLDAIAPPDPFLPRVLWPRSLVLWNSTRGHLSEWIAAGVTAWVASIPLMLFYFDLWSPATLPANLLGGILTFAVIGLGIGSAVAGSCCNWLAAVLNNATWLFTKALLAVITFFATFPGGYRFVDKGSFYRRPPCEVEILHLPAGAAIHVRANPTQAGNCRRDWLIDCGSIRAFPQTVLPYLHTQGVNRLDGFVITHGDSKHIGGATALLNALEPVDVIDSGLSDRSSHRKTFQLGLANSKGGKSIVDRGDFLTLTPRLTMHVLFPPEGLSARSADDKALVLRLDLEPGFGGTTGPGTRILFMSDAGFITEHWLLEHAIAGELHSDIIVKGMHAKDLSGTPEFLDAVRPRLVIASSTDFPPAEEVREPWEKTVRQRGIELIRQDRCGAVRIALERNGTWTAVPFTKTIPK